MTENQTEHIALDAEHLCNTCVHRQQGDLLTIPLVVLQVRRHRCGKAIRPARVKKRYGNAVYACSGYQCQHGRGILDCELTTCRCAGGGL